ncbi:MAG: hydrogenase nickel incorporation protein HypB, partial [Candidatus Bathyarchaeia archaeon]
MCLAIPGLLIEVDGVTGKVDFGDGTIRRVNLALLEEAKPGDYVLVHAGYAIQIVPEDYAHETLELWRKMLSMEGGLDLNMEGLSKIIVGKDEGEKLDIELEESVIKRNMMIADENRRILDDNRVRAVDVMGATGSGKTTLILQVCRRLKAKYRIAVIKGDLTSSIDSDMILREGVRSVQVNTGRECHLDASQIRRALEKLDLSNLDLILIENVGNLICPAEFPLGSHKRIVVVSVTEGPYTVVKHPFMFIDADIVVINK